MFSVLRRVGRSPFERGYAHGSAGNIGARLDDGLLITPTDACLGDLDPGRLAQGGRCGRAALGRRASKTLALHRVIYDGDPAERDGCAAADHAVLTIRNDRR